jgi:hypothetical protein
VAADRKAMKELLRLVGFPATPTLVIDQEVLRGFRVNLRRIEELVQ